MSAPALEVREGQAPGLTRTAELLLRSPSELLGRARLGEPGLPELHLQLVLLAALGFGAFGFVLGLCRSVPMGLLGAPKLAFVGLGSLAICLPALYVFGKLLGNPSRPFEVVGEALTAVATTGMTLLALCPVLLAYSRLVAAAQGAYLYLVLGAAGLLSFACLRGIAVLFGAVRRARRPTVHLLAWTVMFGLVGLQCAWLVRPLVGVPGAQVALLRPLERTAYDALWRTTVSALDTLFGRPPRSPPPPTPCPRSE